MVLLPLDMAGFFNSVYNQLIVPPLVGVGIMFGPVIGPTLGGLLSELYSWRWAFYMIVPAGVTSRIVVTTTAADATAIRARTLPCNDRRTARYTSATETLASIPRFTEYDIGIRPTPASMP